MRAMEIGLAGLVVALMAAAPVDAYAQGRGQGKAKGHAKQEAGPPGHVKEQRNDPGRGVVIIDDDIDDAGVVIRTTRGDRNERRIRRDNGRVILRDDDGRVIVIGDGDIDERFRADRGRGPKFCRTGSGHPVFGRRWCLEKGFGLGDRDDVFFDDGRVIFWDEDNAVIVRDRRFRSDRGLWEEIFDRVLFWAD